MAYLVDTNVISELRRKSANANVRAWQREQKAGDLWISVLSILEIREGTERVRAADPTFASKLDRWYQNVLLNIYANRILPVTLAICEQKAAMSRDRTLPFVDGLIGATAKHHNLTLVTRNVKDFEDVVIDLINPWEHPTD